MSNKAAQRQIIGSVQGIEGFFAQVSGGEITASAEKTYDGGSLTPETLCGVREIGNITVTRSFEPRRDESILKSLRAKVGRERRDITVITTDCDLIPVGTPRVYPEAVLVGLTEPEGDASSGAPAMFSLVWSVGAVGP